MDFIFIIILFALVLVVCLLLFIKLQAVLKKLNTDSEHTFQLKILQDKVETLYSRLPDLQLKIAEQLSQETGKTTQTLGTHFTKTQELGFAQLTALNEGIIKLTDSFQTRLNEGLKLLNDTNKTQLETLSKTNQDRLNVIQETVEKRLDENLRRNLESFVAVKEDLVKMQNHATKMIDSTKSIDRLNDIFGKGAAKSFGTFSEEMLGHFLEDTIPGQYEAQFQIPGSAEKIDFVIKLAEQKIGVDSKFPLDTYEAYRSAEGEARAPAHKIFINAVKFMVEDIAKKYVASKFFDQTYIYFPSDSLYLEVANDESLAKLMRTKKVYPSSPSTIMPMIGLVAQYRQRVEVNANAESIINGMQKIDKHIDAFKEEFRKLGDKLRLAQDNYVSAERSLEGVHREVNLLGGSTDTQPLELN
jgi:DNA anti-recombination protein RmuC